MSEQQRPGSKLNFLGLVEVPIPTAVAWLVIVIAAGGAVWWNWSTVCGRLGLCYPECRIAANGIEGWKVVKPRAADSGWIGGGSNPTKYCGGQLKSLQAENPTHKIELVGKHEAHETKHRPFKEDYYRYTCEFRVSEPVYKLAENKLCPER